MTVVEKSKTEAKLPLDSLEIKGYRCFKQLTIPKLARVNLITGKNNVGKTSLLEAVNLWARRGSPDSFWQVLQHRGLVNSDFRGSSETNSHLIETVVRMFNGAEVDGSIIQRSPLHFTLSPSNPDERLGVSIYWPGREGMETTVPGIFADFPQRNQHPGRSIIYAMERIVDPINRVSFESVGAVQCNTVWARGLSQLETGKFWDAAWRNNLKDEILNGLNIIGGDLEDLAMQGDIGIGLGRMPFIKRPQSQPEPLSQLGDGMTHLFDILLAGVNASSGLLIIDEIGRGLHYSVLNHAWSMIFAMARELNVQVFATTHSWECIQAFEEALSSSEENDGELIRLEQKNGEIVSTVFEKRRVKVVAEDWIEVR